jgi:hypothetical protein
MYLKDRVNDLTDVGGAKILAGRGGQLAASFGYERSFGLGYYDFRKYGWDGRSFGIGADSGQQLVVMVERDYQALAGTESMEDLEREILGAYRENDRVLPARRFRNAFDVQLTAALIAGVEVNFSPIQLVDFILGWIGIDVADDDAFWHHTHADWQGQPDDDELHTSRHGGVASDR